MIVKFTPNDICLDPPMNAITVEQTNYLHCPTSDPVSTKRKRKSDSKRNSKKY